MCTLTWVAGGGGYELFFNRDERHTRARALPPATHERGVARWIAPTDPDGGGTWLGVNHHGVALGLLNGYRGGDLAAREFESRGALVAQLLDVASLAELRGRLAAVELARYRSFQLVAFEPDAALRAEWDGAELVLSALTDDAQPVCSSSLDPIGAGASRRALYERRFANDTPTRAALAAFHASHEPERGTLSPCMHRTDAATVSYSHVVVTSSRVRFEYTPGSPCAGLAPLALELARAPAKSRAG